MCLYFIVHNEIKVAYDRPTLSLVLSMSVLVCQLPMVCINALDSSHPSI